jgi:hypothetical protein
MEAVGGMAADGMVAVGAADFAAVFAGAGMEARGVGGPDTGGVGGEACRLVTTLIGAGAILIIGALLIGAGEVDTGAGGALTGAAVFAGAGVDVGGASWQLIAQPNEQRRWHANGISFPRHCVLSRVDAHFIAQRFNPRDTILG